MAIKKGKRVVIPGQILADLIKGDKVRVWTRQDRCCGIVYWYDGKLRYSSTMDLK